MKTKLEFHEVASIFPLMVGQEYINLKNDIKNNGLIDPIILYENKVLDGRNRYNACIELEIDPTFIEYAGEQEPLDYVLSKNLHRRHLNETQRTLVASKIANMQRGEYHGNQYIEVSANLRIPKVSQVKAAKMLNVSPRSISSVKAIEREAPELLPKMESGEMSAHEAQTIIRRKEQVNKAQLLAQPDLPQKRYSVIYADPPWQYDFSLTSNRDIENQYPTMTLEQICNLEIVDICANDCVLFLWATNPKLREAFAVIDAWGFTYKTNMVWIKDKIGMGYYARQRHELLLIATKGSPIIPSPENRPDSVIEGVRSEHSKKPEQVYQVIKSMYPDYPAIELFSRNAKKGWETWGNQI